MSTSKPLSGNAINHNGATLYNAGNLTNSEAVTKNVTPTEDDHGRATGGIQAVANESAKVISAGPFANQEAGEYIATTIGDKIAGQTDTFLVSSTSHAAGQKAQNLNNRQERLHITSWDYATGVATYGSGRGLVMNNFDPESNTYNTGEPLPTKAIPGRFTYYDGSSTPINDTYNAET